MWKVLILRGLGINFLLLKLCLICLDYRIEDCNTFLVGIWQGKWVDGQKVIRAADRVIVP